MGKASLGKSARLRHSQYAKNITNVVEYIDFGLYFNRIKKAGNSSTLFHLTETLYGAKLENPEQMFETYRHNKQIALSYARSLSVADLAVRAQRLEKGVWFSVVRDPLSRTLSAYLQGRDRYEQRERKYEPFSFFGDNNQKRGFHRFVTYLSQASQFINSHWAPQCELMFLPPNRFDFLVHLEDFGKGFTDVLKAIGAPPPVAWKEKGLLAHSAEGGRKISLATEKMSYFYDSQTKKLVREIYREDFETLGYS